MRYRRTEIITLLYIGLLCLLLFLGLLLSFSDSTVANQRKSTQRDFLNFYKAHPGEIFQPSILQRGKDCLHAFQSRAALPNGLKYGDSVRAYSLQQKTTAEVERDMKKMQCKLRVDVLREPLNHEPLLYKGHTVPLWAFLCADGGVIRIKPQGDPLNPYRPQPHGSKSLRFPYDSKFENFSDEILKVDSEGNAIPKSKADLAPKQLADGWAEDAHVDLN